MQQKTTRPARKTKARGGAIAVASLLASFCGFVSSAAHAQRGAVDFGMVYTQERSKFVGSSPNDYFYLRGATLDLGYSLWHGIGVTGSATGLAGTNLQTNIDIHHVEMLGGVRYTHNLGHITPTVWARKGGIFLQAKGGYTFATSGLYPVNGVVATSASALTYVGGGGINFHVYERFDVRLAEVDYVISHLPNGGTNQQNTLRFGAGLNFHFGP
jgi:hypothetical protein